MRGRARAAALLLLAAAAGAATAGAGAPAAAAQGGEAIEFTVEQSEYYFVAGGEAVIDMEVRNEHGRNVGGTLSHTVTETVSSGGAAAQMRRSDAVPFTVAAGNSSVRIDLGAGAVPSTKLFELSFTYTEGAVSRFVALGPITIHTVADESQADNRPDPVSGRSQQGAPPPQGQQAPPQGQQQGGAGQPQGQGQQPPRPPDPHSRLQNNQMDQDSSALRRQIQERVEEEARERDALAERLFADERFAERHAELLEEGYAVTRSAVDPAPGGGREDPGAGGGQDPGAGGGQQDPGAGGGQQDPGAGGGRQDPGAGGQDPGAGGGQQDPGAGGGQQDPGAGGGQQDPGAGGQDPGAGGGQQDPGAGGGQQDPGAGGGGGSFEVEYENAEGEWASVSGQMEEGAVTEIETQTQDHQERVAEALRQDERFRQFEAQLAAAGFSESGMEFAGDANGTTTATVRYESGGGAGAGEEAEITAVFEDGRVVEVALEGGPEEEEKDWEEFLASAGIAALLAAALGGAVAAALRASRKGGAAEPAPAAAPAAAPRPDRAAAAAGLMAEAKRLHGEGDEKAAFAAAGRAVRLLLARGRGIGGEVSNEEICEEIRRAPEGGGPPAGEVEGCLRTATLVEFAMAEPAGGDFARIDSLFSRLEEAGRG